MEISLQAPLPSLEATILSSRERAEATFYPTNLITIPEPLGEGARLRVAAKLVDDYRNAAFKSKPPGAPSTVAAAQSASPSPFVGGPPSAGRLLTDGQGPLLRLTNGDAQTSSSSSSTALAIIARTSGGAVGGVASSAAAGPAGIAAAGSIAAAGAGAVAAVEAVVATVQARHQPKGVASDSLVAYQKASDAAQKAQESSRTALARRQPAKIPTPDWHAPWKLSKVIAGHLGWVRCISVDPSNDFFVTGAADRTIKVWDLASGTLRLTLTGHINTVRGVAMSPRHPYLFSCGEDKMVKCWDLETNKVIRHYHGHLSGVYSIAVHPTLDVIMTGGRDSVCRVWDMRTKRQVHMLGGHENTVASILTNSVDPQVITGSMDSTIRTWDLAAGKVRSILTHHKKAVRALVGHHSEFTFLSGGADSIRKWALPDGVLVNNFTGHDSIVNALAMNHDNVLVSGGDDGSLKFWDYTTGYAFQDIATRVQPGSLDAEAGIYAMAFDMSGSRLITCEADKSIKIYKEAEDADETTHPIDMKAWEDKCRALRRY